MESRIGRLIRNFETEFHMYVAGLTRRLHWDASKTSLNLSRYSIEHVRLLVSRAGDYSAVHHLERKIKHTHTKILIQRLKSLNLLIMYNVYFWY